jgi:AraC-like DNA-binding protein
MEHIANEIIAAEDMWYKEIDFLCDAMQSSNDIEKAIVILEAFLLSKYLHTSLHYRVDNVNDALLIIDRCKGAVSIKELQSQTNTSRKTLERAFTHYLGTTPKLYTQIIKFNTAKELIDKATYSDISDLAFDLGYYDNSHFTAEFKRFCGTTPKQYIKQLKGME